MILNDVTVQILESSLNQIITEQLIGSSDEPLYECNLLSAARAYHLLVHLNLPIHQKELILPVLTGDNSEGINYLQDSRVLQLTLEGELVEEQSDSYMKLLIYRSPQQPNKAGVYCSFTNKNGVVRETYFGGPSKNINGVDMEYIQWRFPHVTDTEELDFIKREYQKQIISFI